MIHTAAQITLTCESEAAAGAIGKLQLWQGDTLLAESDVPSGNAEVTLQAPACEDCYLLLTFDPGCEAVVGGPFLILSHMANTAAGQSPAAVFFITMHYISSATRSRSA